MSTLKGVNSRFGLARKEVIPRPFMRMAVYSAFIEEYATTPNLAFINVGPEG